MEIIKKGTLCRIKNTASPPEVAGHLCEVTGDGAPCGRLACLYAGSHHLSYPVHVPAYPLCQAACGNALIPIVPPGNPDAEDRDIPVLTDDRIPEELLK